jgi:poly(3-hydroxybutyrate) depolymerase
MKLLVALHGDEGRDLGLEAATGGVVSLWQQASDAAGYLLFAPACPAARGCNGAFSDWLAADGYDPSPEALAWLDERVDELERRYNVDRAREYLAGYSGGAYWLGAYAPARASRFAAVAFVAGGMPAYHAFHGCPARRLPGYFLGGDGDFRTEGQMSDTASAFVACGQEIELDLVANADHQATIASLATGRAAAILTWFGSRPR